MTTRRGFKLDVLLEDGQHYALSLRSVLKNSAAIHHRISLTGDEHSARVFATHDVGIVDSSYGDRFFL